MKKLFVLLAFILVVFCGYSQNAPLYDFSKFTPLQSSGLLPDVVGMSGRDFMSTSRKNLTKGGTYKEKKVKEQFVLQTSYAIKDIFNSGRVLYNDPISEYVNKVHKEITVSDPQLASETKVFVVKSTVVNAFATNQGFIFITTGLLSQLENEAQLAFVLCHELIHYQKKHVVKAYVENNKIDRGAGGYRKTDIDRRYLAKANYSREHESDADNLGFDLYVKTKYSLDAIDGLFDVLKYSELPFEDIEFNPKKLLETEHLVFPVGYIKSEITEVEGADEEEDDRTSTHPNLKKRRSDIADKIATVSGEDKLRVRNIFVVSESLFMNARKLARFDLCHSSLINRQYDKALYQAYCLLNDDADNVYLNKVVLKSLYGLTKYYNTRRLREVSTKPSKVQGESQRLNFLIDQLDNGEMNVVALNFAWRLKKKLGNSDIEVNLITDDLFYELVRRYYADKSSFSLLPKDASKPAVLPGGFDETGTAETAKMKNGEAETGNTDEDDEDAPKSKTGKLKKKKKKNDDAEEIDSDSYISFAFVDLLKDSAFVNTYDRIIGQIKKDKSTEKKADARQRIASTKSARNYSSYDDYDYDYGDDNSNYTSGYNLDRAESNTYYNDKLDCYALGLDKVLVLNPFYLKIDDRKNTPVLYEGSEGAQKDYNGKIIEISKKVKLDTDILDKNEFTSTSVSDYNDMCVLIDWVDERVDHEELKMIPVDYSRINEIAKKYNTDYMAISGTINFVEKKKFMGLAIVASVIAPVFSWVATFPYMFSSNTTTYVYTIVYNMKTGNNEMTKVGQVRISDANDIVNSLLYDHFKQIKRSGYGANK